MDEATRRNTIEKNMPLVGYVTARFMGRGYEYEDLYQYGCIGLIKAVDRFDNSYGVAFSTYAVPLIIGEIKRFMRGDGAVHVSRTIKENAYKVMEVIEKCEKEGRSISLDYVSNEVGIEKQEVVLAFSALCPVRSIYEPIGGEGEILLQDIIGKMDDNNINDYIALKQALSELDEKERELIIRRYYKGHTQTAIAEEKGMSQVQISRSERNILKKLRTKLN